MEATAADFQQFILGRIDDPLQAKGLAAAEVPSSFDLLLEGVIDSFGIVELISALEEHYGLEFDFETMGQLIREYGLELG